MQTLTLKQSRAAITCARSFSLQEIKLHVKLLSYARPARPSPYVSCIRVPLRLSPRTGPSPREVLLDGDRRRRVYISPRKDIAHAGSTSRGGRVQGSAAARRRCRERAALISQRRRRGTRSIRGRSRRVRSRAQLPLSPRRGGACAPRRRRRWRLRLWRGRRTASPCRAGLNLIFCSALPTKKRGEKTQLRKQGAPASALATRRRVGALEPTRQSCIARHSASPSLPMSVIRPR